MLDFLSRIFGKDNSTSKDIAKERLRLVLVHDRASVTPEFLEDIKGELLAVIKEYMEVDEDEIKVSLDNMEDSVALVANIPVKRMKRKAQPENMN